MRSSLRTATAAFASRVAKNAATFRLLIPRCALSKSAKEAKYGSVPSLCGHCRTWAWASVPQSMPHQPQKWQGQRLHDRAKQPVKSMNACRQLGRGHFCVSSSSAMCLIETCYPWGLPMPKRCFKGWICVAETVWLKSDGGATWRGA